MKGITIEKKNFLNCGACETYTTKKNHEELVDENVVFLLCVLQNAAVPEGKETKTGHDERNSFPVAWLDMVYIIGVASLTLRQCFCQQKLKWGVLSARFGVQSTTKFSLGWLCARFVVKSSTGGALCTQCAPR
jgi:hypothetical protein